MLTLWKKHQKFLKGDAGFSLVELIIVIAIMAALIAILAPQYIKYVERSRKQADITVATEVLNAAKVAASDPDNTDIDFTVAWDIDAGTITVTNLDDATLITDVIGSDVGEAKSDFSTTAGDFTVTVVDGVASVTAAWATDLGVTATAAGS